MSLWGLIGIVALLVCTATVTMALPGRVAAATSNTINFQARLETASGAIAPDGNYNVEFKLYNASSSSGSSQGSCTGDASCLWVETRTSANQVRVVNGYLTVNLGSVTTLPSINWSQQLWLTMNIGGTGASAVWDGEMNPRIQLTAVPYAFTASQLGAASGSNVATLSFGTISANDSITLPDASGTVCLQNATACGFAPASGGTGYVNLQATTPGTAQTGNFNISGAGILSALQSASAASGTTLTVQAGAATSGTNTGGTLLLQGGAGAGTGASGSVVVKANTNDSTTAFQVQNAAGTPIVGVDTLNNTVSIDNTLVVQQPTSCNYTSYVNDVLSLSPSGYWKLEDTSGTTAVDSSGNSDTGTISATGVTLNQTPGPFSCAPTHPYMVFNSANSGGILSANTYASPTAFSLIVLFKSGSNGPLFSSGGDRGLYIGSDGKLYASVSSGAHVASPGAVNDGNWHEAVMTFDSSIGRLGMYLDGTFVASTTGSVGNPNVDWELGHLSGAWFNLPSAYYTGSLAQAAVIPSVIGAATATDLAKFAGVYTGTAVGGVGIGLAGSPSYLLDVGGDINSSTAIRAPLLDTASAAALALGASNATSIALGNATNNVQTTINGTALIKPTSGHDSTTAFQVQNAGGAAILTIDTTNGQAIINGNLVVNAAAGYSGNLAVYEVNGSAQFAISATGHLISSGSAPTAGAISNCGTSPSLAIASGSTDARGMVTLTTGSGAPTTSCTAVVTFANAYGAVPYVVVSSDAAQVAVPIVSATATGSFTIGFNGTAPLASTAYAISYIVIQ